jgi:hypothetical protein
LGFGWKGLLLGCLVWLGLSGRCFGMFYPLANDLYQLIALGMNLKLWLGLFLCVTLFLWASLSPIERLSTKHGCLR